MMGRVTRYGRTRDRGFSVIWALSGEKGEVTKSGNTCWSRCAYGHMKEIYIEYPILFTNFCSFGK